MNTCKVFVFIPCSVELLSFEVDCKVDMTFSAGTVVNVASVAVFLVPRSKNVTSVFVLVCNSVNIDTRPVRQTCGHGKSICKLNYSWYCVTW